MRRTDQSSTRDDTGSVSMFVVVVVLALLVAAGLAVDGGGKITAQQRATVAAEEAARTAGQSINVANSVQGRAATVDPYTAAAAARRYLATADVQGTVTIASPTTITIDTTATYEPVILSLIGVGTLTGRGSATATLTGTLRGGQVAP